MHIRKSVPIHLTLHFPEEEAALRELGRRVALIHADAVRGRLERLSCPAEQKRKLLEILMAETGRKQDE